MKLAVIIPYYNGAEFIDRCLDSLECHSPIEIFIVDNSEVPFTSAQDVNLIRMSQSRVGFGRAVNRGLEEVYVRDFTHVLVLNQDAFFAQEHFDRLCNYLTANPLDRFASPMIYTEDLNEVMPFIMERYFSRGLPAVISDISDFVAVALIAPVALMQSLEGFDTKYFMYYEDNDLITRSQIVNPVRILPDIHVGHHNPDLNPGHTMPIEKQRWQRVSELRYLRRHGEPRMWLSKLIKHYAKLLLGR